MPTLSTLPTVAETALTELENLGVSVSLDKSGGLRVMPRKAVTDQVRNVVKLFRSELLGYLQDRAETVSSNVPVAATDTPDLLQGLGPLAAASWRDKGYYKASSAIFDDVIIRATDTAPIHELHDGCVVYRNREILRQMRDPQPLDMWHQYRKALFERWSGDGWKAHKQIGQLRAAAGIPDHHRRKVVSLVEHLVVCGVIEFGESDGRALLSDCYRIVPPGRRAKIEP